MAYHVAEYINSNDSLRQDWQRSIACAAYGHLTREMLPLMFDDVDDTSLAAVILMGPRQTLLRSSQPDGPIGNGKPGNTAVATAFELAEIAQPPFNLEDSNHLMERALGATAYARFGTDERLAKETDYFTFAKLHALVMQEGFATLLHFPINLLIVAMDQAPAGSVPLIRTLEDVAHILAEPWFQKVVATAASTRNGLWRGFSASSIFHYSATVSEVVADMKLQHVLCFDYSSPGPDLPPTFDFTTSAKSELKAARLQHNTRLFHAIQSKAWNDRTASGTSSGCPVNRHVPVFSDPADRAYIAELFGVSTEETAERWPETPIATAMNTYAEYLLRAHRIAGRFEQSDGEE